MTSGNWQSMIAYDRWRPTIGGRQLVRVTKIIYNTLEIELREAPWVLTWHDAICAISIGIQGINFIDGIVSNIKYKFSYIVKAIRRNLLLDWIS